jgi:hypothetical protein|tara:strand:+ start:150 stop:251 length:102 start_codon:yes stop_codon:yes gene_type:complete
MQSEFLSYKDKISKINIISSNYSFEEDVFVNGK